MKILLEKIQRDLQNIYHISIPQRINDFLIDENTFHIVSKKLGQHNVDFSSDGILILQENDQLNLAVFISDEILRNLRLNNPFSQLNFYNLNDFLTVAEEVSHFIYIIWNAINQRQVSQLELELQAEVDKYITSIFYLGLQNNGIISSYLKYRLFDNFRITKNSNSEIIDRYNMANKMAFRYCSSLERRFIKKIDFKGMLSDLRKFYRFSYRNKLEYITNN